MRLEKSAVVTVAMWVSLLNSAASGAGFFPGSYTHSVRPCSAHGALHEWYAVSDQDNIDGLNDAFLANASVLPEFRPGNGTSWWSGSQTPVASLVSYPEEVVQPITGFNDADNDSYAVRATSRLNVTQPGPYRFTDGSDDFSYLAIDLDGDPMTPLNVLINDDNATNLDHTDANGPGDTPIGAPIVEVSFTGDIPAEGSLRDIQYVMAERTGTDSGVVYWNFDTQTDAFIAEFPAPGEDTEPINPDWHIPNTHLKYFEEACRNEGLTDEDFLMDWDPNVAAFRAHIGFVDAVLDSQFGNLGFFPLNGYEFINGTPSEEPDGTWVVEMVHTSPQDLPRPNGHNVAFTTKYLDPVEFRGAYKMFARGDDFAVPFDAETGELGERFPGPSTTEDALPACYAYGINLDVETCLNWIEVHDQRGDWGRVQPRLEREQQGEVGDARVSVVYDPQTGELRLDVPGGRPLRLIEILSSGAIFDGGPAQNLDGDFDADADDRIFKVTFGDRGFGSFSFGEVARLGLSREEVLNNLTVFGSFLEHGDLSEVDLVYIPEPTAFALLAGGILVTCAALRGYRSCLKTQ